MYNLLIGRVDGLVAEDRLLELTDWSIRSYIAPGQVVDVSRLLNLPALKMPELQDQSSPQVARVGHISNLTHSGSQYRFQFIPNPDVPPIATEKIAAEAIRLGIDSREFNRTHWAVKDVDLYRILREEILTPIASPEVFRLPISLARDQGLVAVMMPFDGRFDSVYSALRQAVSDSGLQCNRADDIWIHDQIMDDVVNLIWRARLVISDFSSKNANVFYETGIAHTLGRQVIQITQSMGDVPFDLRSIRTITYLPNTEGLESLKAAVSERIRYLIAAN